MSFPCVCNVVGMKRAGLITHFLVGIVDSIDAQVERMDGGAATSTKFLTLGKISGGGKCALIF